MAISENTKDTLIAVAMLGTMFIFGLGEGAALAYGRFAKNESNKLKADILDHQVRLEQLKKVYERSAQDISMSMTEENTTDEEA